MRPFQGKELLQEKLQIAEQYQQFVVFSPTLGRTNKYFTSYSNMRNTLIVVGSKELKTSFTWGTAAEPDNFRNAED